MANQRFDPYYGFNFSVELDGVTAGAFGQCLGLSNSTNVIQGRSGNDKYQSLKKFPGLVTYSDVTLTRGFTNDTKLWNWRLTVMKGDIERRDISITLLNSKLKAVITWQLFEAWPREWVGPAFNAGADEIAVEKLVIAYERFTVTDWGDVKDQWSL